MVQCGECPDAFWFSAEVYLALTIPNYSKPSQTIHVTLTGIRSWSRTITIIIHVFTQD
jgi:hypothetical protein